MYNLHSNSKRLLTPYPILTKAYTVNVPSSLHHLHLWNNLSNHIKDSPTREQFKAVLKTHLFTSIETSVIVIIIIIIIIIMIRLYKIQIT